MADKDFFAFADYPLVAMISGNSPRFAYHPIVDRSTWSLLVAHKIYHGLLEEHLGMVGGLSSQRYASIPGTHFCFLGLSGGQAVADAIERFSGEFDAIKMELTELTGMDASGL